MTVITKRKARKRSLDTRQLNASLRLQTSDQTHSGLQDQQVLTRDIP